ncbi:hypothetical protein SPI_08592 [Niveomyces insectorum RCEF 264]|uniref:Uncharacterized protein n=1 Tax=Niveomyces insectorum RCEF 264 TaxID=1081102 RepID=A0A167MT50_9HYPO|nr:hypothetical protein SPI_08592 [Niveomyces insectorum RCEF 264]
MPLEARVSVEVVSTERAQRMQRKTSTDATATGEVSMLRRYKLLLPDDDRDGMSQCFFDESRETEDVMLFPERERRALPGG